MTIRPKSAGGIDADGSPSLSVIHPDDLDAARKSVSHSFATDELYIQTFTLPGETRTVP
jgi:hypothetical protein